MLQEVKFKIPPVMLIDILTSPGQELKTVTLGVDGIGPLTGRILGEDKDNKGRFILLEERCKGFSFVYVHRIRVQDICLVEVHVR